MSKLNSEAGNALNVCYNFWWHSPFLLISCKVDIRNGRADDKTKWIISNARSQVSFWLDIKTGKLLVWCDRPTAKVTHTRPINPSYRPPYHNHNSCTKRYDSNGKPCLGEAINNKVHYQYPESREMCVSDFCACSKLLSAPCPLA